MVDLRDTSVTVVVPAYNEERRIAAGLLSIDSFLKTSGARYDIVVVDDGSTDKTVATVQALQPEMPALRLLRLLQNSGKGSAVTAGMLSATNDFVLFTDADQATSIDHLIPLLQAMRESSCAVAIASRNANGAVLEKRQSWHRELMGRSFGFLMKSLLIRGVRDSQCGFKCFTREAAQNIFSRMTCRNALFDMEALLLAGRLGYRVAEVPVRWVHDPDSRLVYSTAQSIALLGELLRIRRKWGVKWPVRIDVVSMPPSLQLYQVQDYLVREVDLYAGKKYEIILQWLSQRSCSRVLNVGCGSGELSIQLARHGYTVDAVDSSEDAVRISQTRLKEAGVSGVSIQLADLLSYKPAKPYDAIVCLDVVEHLPDDRRAVEHLRDLLKPNGALFIAVPALQSLYGFHDEQLGHYRRYSRTQLVNLLREFYRVGRCRYFGFSLIPIALLYSRLLRRPYPVSKSTGTLAKFVLDMESRINVPVGTSLLIEATKAN